jgi:hypothetical protein
MATDKELYQKIADEIAARNVDAALWAQAMGIADGDEAKTQAAYVRLRFADLKKTTVPRAPGQAGGAGARSAGNDISAVRTELRRKLLELNKMSLYSTLGVQPDASDEVIAAAIADLDSRNMAGLSAAEGKYARQTLGDPVLREQYDRKLLADLKSSLGGAARPHSYEYAEDKVGWSSGKTSFAIMVLAIAIMGYLALDFYRARNEHDVQKAAVSVNSQAVDVQKDAVGVQREAVQSSTSIEQERLQNENALRQRSLDIAEEQQRRQLDMQAAAQERMRQEQETRLKAQQQQQEEMQRQREQQYWNCMNQQLDMRGVTSYDASARCGRYR